MELPRSQWCDLRLKEELRRMLNLVLVPLDGSPLAERALPYATLLAERACAPLLLARVVPHPSHPGQAEGEEGESRDAQDYLRGVADRLAEAGVTAEVAVIHHDSGTSNAASSLLEEARRREANLIVMSTHGRSGLGRWVYGSVAEAVMADAEIPVLLVRSWEETPAVAPLAERPLLLVPLDGSTLAEQALPVAESFADELSGELLLLQSVLRPDVLTAPDRWITSSLEEDTVTLMIEARDYLRTVADRYWSQGREVRVETRVGDPSHVITATAQERGAAMVVMTSHGYSGAVRLVFGSVASAVLRQGRVPVLLIGPKVLEAVAPLAAEA